MSVKKHNEQNRRGIILGNLVGLTIFSNSKWVQAEEGGIVGADLKGSQNYSGQEPIIYIASNEKVTNNEVNQTAVTKKIPKDANQVVKTPENAAVPVKTNGQQQQNQQQQQQKMSTAPLDAVQLDEEAQRRLLDEEEDRRKAQRKKKKGRIRELEEIRSQLAEKEIILLGKEKELLEKEQSIEVLQQELELERKLRALLTKEKERAEEEAALAMGLCVGGGFP